MANQKANQKILFQDKDVKITQQFVQIKWYFFPFGGTKKIAVKDIKKVEKRQLKWAKARLWGMDASNWGYWLAADKNRFSRTHFIGITVQSSVKPSFTTESIDIVYNILQQLVAGRDGNSVNQLSQKSSEVVQMRQLKVQ